MFIKTGMTQIVFEKSRIIYCFTVLFIIKWLIRKPCAVRMPVLNSGLFAFKVTVDVNKGIEKKVSVQVSIVI